MNDVTWGDVLFDITIWSAISFLTLSMGIISSPVDLSAGYPFRFRFFRDFLTGASSLFLRLSSNLLYIILCYPAIHSGTLEHVQLRIAYSLLGRNTSYKRRDKFPGRCPALHVMR